MKRYLPACLFLLSLSAHGALYKWVDAEDKVHYSDAPPSNNIKSERLKAPAGADAPTSASGVPGAKSLAEREAEYRKSQKEKQEAEQKAARQQEEMLAKQKNCEAAQQNLRTLEAGGLIVTYDAKGEASFLGESVRQQRIEEARKAVSTHCN